jgi:hypothetical protein
VQQLSPSSLDSFYPQPALDALGRATVVWTTGQNTLFAARIDENGAASAGVQISGPSPTGAIDPASVDVDSQGQAVVAWFAGDNSSVNVMRMGVDGTPGQIHALTPAQTTIRSGPVVAVDSQDRASVVWPGTDADGDVRVFAARLGADETLSPVSRVSGPSDNITEVLDVEVGPGDRASLVWSRDTGRGLRVEHAFGGPETAPPNATIVTGPRKRSRDRTPAFTLISDVVGASFQCKLDKGRFRPCDAEFTRRVGVGRHVLRAIATDADGGDTSPARWRFRVVRKKR